MKKTARRSYEYTAQFRFYEELNDFLPNSKRRETFFYYFNGNPAIKDPIEALGVPHTEVGLIIVNGRSVGFDYQLKNNDHVSVYPVFESIDIAPIVKLRNEPLRKNAFILDVHLGKLAKMLRMLGFDTVYETDYDDSEIIRRSLEEKRIIITRDRRLLHTKVVAHGYCIRSTNSEEQLREVLNRFDLYSQIRPFCRCMVCNGKVRKVKKSAILHKLEPKTIKFYDEFFMCERCCRIYWKGSHHERLRERFGKIHQYHKEYKKKKIRLKEQYPCVRKS